MRAAILSVLFLLAVVLQSQADTSCAGDGCAPVATISARQIYTFGTAVDIAGSVALDAVYSRTRDQLLKSTIGYRMIRNGHLTGYSCVGEFKSHVTNGDMTFSFRVENQGVWTNTITVTGNGVFEFSGTQDDGIDPILAGEMLVLFLDGDGTLDSTLDYHLCHIEVTVD